MGQVGIKTRSPGQIIKKPCEHSRFNETIIVRKLLIVSGGRHMAILALLFKIMKT